MRIKTTSKPIIKYTLETHQILHNFYKHLKWEHSALSLEKLKLVEKEAKTSDNRVRL